MRSLILLVGLVVIGVIGWRVGSRLSPDAMGLAIGIVFGVLAGLPTALLVLASNRRRGDGDEAGNHRQRQGNAGAYPYGGYPQPPVIVLAGPGAAPTAPPPPAAPDRYERLPALPAPREERQFRVYGDAEDIVDDDFTA